MQQPYWMISAALGVCALAGTIFAAEGTDKAAADKPATRPASSVLDFTADDISGNPVDLSKYKGKVLLIVNVASKCGMTPQYEPLEKLYKAKKGEGLAILAFPANDFKQQEPGTNEQIKEFCTGKYDVTFDLFSKTAVTGDAKAPLYQFLTAKETNPQFGGEIKWNFTKFLVDRQGKVVARFEPKDKPDDKKVVEAIEAELAKK